MNDFFGQESKIGACVFLLKLNKGFEAKKKIIETNQFLSEENCKYFFLSKICNMFGSKKIVVYEIMDKKGTLIDLIVSPYLWHPSVIENKLDKFV